MYVGILVDTISQNSLGMSSLKNPQIPGVAESELSLAMSRVLLNWIQIFAKIRKMAEAYGTDSYLQLLSMSWKAFVDNTCIPYYSPTRSKTAT